MASNLDAQIEAALGQAPSAKRPISGGCVSDVMQLSMPDGSEVIAKLGKPGSGLKTEGWMLRYLSKHSRLPVPEVLYESDTLLAMEYIPNVGGIDRNAQVDAADLLAALHNISAPKYGLERDTLIGCLNQANPQSKKWLPFFRDQRLLYMGRQSVEAGRMPRLLLSRLENFCARLDEFLEEPAAP